MTMTSKTMTTGGAATGGAATSGAATGAGFCSDLSVRAAPDRVLEALREAGAITGWWGLTTGMPAEGHRFRVAFGGTRQIEMTVSATGPSRVEWAVDAAPHTPEWAGTTIVFEVAPVAEGTEVHFRHDGLTRDLDCYEMCHAGWTHYLASLVSYVETGAGDPYRGD